MSARPAATYEISDIDGSNRRRVTLAQFRAEIDAAAVEAKTISAAQRAEMAGKVCCGGGRH